MARATPARRSPRRWVWPWRGTNRAAASTLLRWRAMPRSRCGITFEALNNIAHHTEKLLVILNDNEWSIDKNVGAVAAYLNKIVTHPQFEDFARPCRKICENDRRAERFSHGEKS